MYAEINKSGILKIRAVTLTEAFAIDCWADSLIHDIEAHPGDARKLINEVVHNVGWLDDIKITQEKTNN